MNASAMIYDIVECVQHDYHKYAIIMIYMQRVIEVCKEHFPSLSAGFSNTKVKFHIGDATDIVQQNQSSFDVVITNHCCDPTFPGKTLLLNIICSYIQVTYSRPRTSRIFIN